MNPKSDIENLPKIYTINVGGTLMDLSRPKVMGILNVTPDSFYSGSRLADKEAVKAKVRLMLEEGADILDIGGYSSRPGAEDISAAKEYERLCFGLEAIREAAPEAVVSVDTFRAEVARKCVEEWKVRIINDIGGGTLDADMYATIADLKVAYVLMHLKGTPATMSRYTQYDDVVAEVISDLAFKASELRMLGVCDLIADPGFGFAKTVEQNYQLLRRLREFEVLGMPVLAGISRKSMIWKTLGVTPEESLTGTIVLNTFALQGGAQILRVHDVKEAVETIRLFEATMIQEN